MLRNEMPTISSVLENANQIMFPRTSEEQYMFTTNYYIQQNIEYSKVYYTPLNNATFLEIYCIMYNEYVGASNCNRR